MLGGAVARPASARAKALDAGTLKCSQSAVSLDHCSTNMRRDGFSASMWTACARQPGSARDRLTCSWLRARASDTPPSFTRTLPSTRIIRFAPTVNSSDSALASVCKARRLYRDRCVVCRSQRRVQHGISTERLSQLAQIRVASIAALRLSESDLCQEPLSVATQPFKHRFSQWRGKARGQLFAH